MYYSILLYLAHNWHTLPTWFALLEEQKVIKPDLTYERQRETVELTQSLLFNHLFVHCYVSSQFTQRMRCIWSPRRQYEDRMVIGAKINPARMHTICSICLLKLQRTPASLRPCSSSCHRDAFHQCVR